MIGHTVKIPRRWQEPLSGKCADWTQEHQPQYIPHYDEFKSREQSIAREKELKTTSGRRWIMQASAEYLTQQAGSVPFKEKMTGLSATLCEQFAEADQLEAANKKDLEVLDYGG